MDKKLDYSKLKDLLDNEDWPKVYMFKFIVPFDVDSLNILKSLFASHAKINHRESKNSQYISFTAKQKMHSSEAIIEIYREAEKIESIIAL